MVLKLPNQALIGNDKIILLLVIKTTDRPVSMRVWLYKEFAI